MDVHPVNAAIAQHGNFSKKIDPRVKPVGDGW
jgi:hypothetical protein